MFRPAKQTDIKFFRYSFHTPHTMSALDGGIDQCTRTSGMNMLFGKTHDPQQRYLKPVLVNDYEPDTDDLQ